MAERVGFNRRALVARGGALGGGLLAGGALAGGAVAGGLVGTERAGAQGGFPGGDLLVLSISLGLEQTLVTVYTAATGSGRLGDGEQRLLELLGGHARVRARALREVIGPASSRSGRPRPGEVPGLDAIDGSRGWLELALGFESQAYLSYLDAVGELIDEESVRLSAQLGAGTAQHLALLRERLGRAPSPSPFETGAGA
jgi:hypothetical protein